MQVTRICSEDEVENKGESSCATRLCMIISLSTRAIYSSTQFGGLAAESPSWFSVGSVSCIHAKSVINECAVRS